MKKKIFTAFLSLLFCMQAACYANDFQKVTNSLFKNFETNTKSAQKPTVQSINIMMNEPQPQTSPVQTAPTQTVPIQTTQTQATADQTTNNNVAQATAESKSESSIIETLKNQIYAPELSSLDALSGLSSQNDGVVSNFDVPNEFLKVRVELPWYNGNYIVWYTKTGIDGVFFVQEFNKSKNETAFAIIIEPYSGDEFYYIYEYGSRKGVQMMKLNTSLVFNVKTKDIALFDAKENLLASRINGNVKIINPQIVTNSEFLNKIAQKFDTYGITLTE